MPVRFLDRRDLAASGPRWARMTLRIEPGLVCIENYPEIRPGSESAKTRTWHQSAITFFIGKLHLETRTTGQATSMCESNSAKVKDDDASSRWEPVSKPWSYYLMAVLLLVLSPLILLFSLIYRIVYYCCLKKPVKETEVPARTATRNSSSAPSRRGRPASRARSRARRRRAYGSSAVS